MKECPRCFICLDDRFEVCPNDGQRLIAGLEGEEVVDGRYRLERKLGEGGMGVVYRARHLELERPFALKLIHPRFLSDSLLARFRREAVALGRLKHPSIVAVTDYGVDPRGGGLPYLVMEYLSGRSMDDLFGGGEPVGVERALPLLESIAAAVDYAHGQGVIHRDLKPGNVFLEEGPEGEEIVKIVDFGLAHLLDDAGRSTHVATAAATLAVPLDPEAAHAAPTVGLDGVDREPLPSSGNSVAGTPGFMAPEVIEGKGAGPPCDIYALGVIAYALCTGRAPFDGSARQLLRGHRLDPPPRPSALETGSPPELDRPLVAALAKEPGQRPPRAADYVSGLTRGWRAARRRSWRRREIPRRLRLAALASLVVAPLVVAAPAIPVVADLELQWTDVRFALSPTRLPDPRLLVAAVDEETLAADPTPLADRAEAFGGLLERVFAAGAAGVAIDFLLPERWSHSPAFSRLVASHHERLTLAAYSDAAGRTLGSTAIGGLTAAALGPANASALFGFVNLEEDTDGVTRRGRRFYRDLSGSRRPSFAARAASTLGPLADGPERIWIDHSIDWSRLARISWLDLPEILESNPTLFDGRLVVVGGDFLASGDDYHRVPPLGSGPAVVSGVVLQTLIVDTLLAGAPIREAARIPVLVVATVVWTAFVSVVLCVRPLWLIGTLFVLASLLYALASVLIFRSSGLLLPVAAPLTAGIAILAGALAVRAFLPPFPRRET